MVEANQESDVPVADPDSGCESPAIYGPAPQLQDVELEASETHSLADCSRGEPVADASRGAPTTGNSGKGDPTAESSRGDPRGQDRTEVEDVEDIAEIERMEQFYIEQLPETWSPEAIAFLQSRNPDLKKVKGWLASHYLPDWEGVAHEGAALKAWWARLDQLVLSVNGVLYLRWEFPDPKKTPVYRIVAVASMFPSILRELHDAKTAGHLGQKKTIARVKASRFFWPGMSEFARRWVIKCVVCAARKSPKHNKRTPMRTYWVGASMDRISLDLTGPFHPQTRRGNTMILTVTDHFTRWVEAFPLRRALAPDIARRVVEFVSRFGIPLEIHSDQGSNVDGKVMQEVSRHMKGGQCPDFQ
jgi:hypothetical protein